MNPTTDAADPPVTLASSLRLPCGVKLKNRIAKSAMSEQLGSPTGDVTPQLINLYRRWAQGGLGMIITGNLMVDARSLSEPRNVVVEDDHDLKALRGWADAARSGGAPAIVQLNHPGRQAIAAASSRVVAPSAVRLKLPGAVFGRPRALEHSEIVELIERFANAAEIAVRAGFDGIQLHAAHGYLISQFLSPLVNLRDDDWGGDAERRRRFLIELVRETRLAVGPEKVVGVKLNSADFQRGGFSEEESLDVIRALGEEGVDFLEISGGTYERPAMMGSGADTAGSGDEAAHSTAATTEAAAGAAPGAAAPSANGARKAASTLAREAYFLEFAERAKQVTQMPLMVTGGLRSSRAMTEALEEGIDIVGLARPVCLEPELPRRLLTDPHAVSRLKPVRTGVRRLDAPADLWWNNIQIHRIANGKEPRRRLSSWEALTHVALRDGVNGLRRKRA